MAILYYAYFRFKSKIEPHLSLLKPFSAEFVEYIKKRNERKKIKDIEQRINDIETAILNINEKLNTISEKIIGLSNK